MSESVPAPLVCAPNWPVLRVVGSEAASWLNGIVTCDVSTVSPERGVFGLLLTKHGKIQAELQILGRPDELSVLVSGGDVADVLTTLSKYLVMEDAEIEQAADLGVLLTVGGADSSFGGALLPWAAEPVVARVAPPAELAEERARLLAAGYEEIAIDEPEVRFRVGLPLYGRDYTAEDNPHDSSLERRAVSWSKGCYLGQEVVCMQDLRGKVKRRIVRLEGDLAGLEAGAVLNGEGGIEAGRLTSVGETVAFGRLKAPFFEASEVECGGRKLSVLPLTKRPG